MAAGERRASGSAPQRIRPLAGGGGSQKTPVGGAGEGTAEERRNPALGFLPRRADDRILVAVGGHPGGDS